jgi:hypothetical protein
MHDARLVANYMLEIAKRIGDAGQIGIAGEILHDINTFGGKNMCSQSHCWNAGCTAPPSSKCSRCARAQFCSAACSTASWPTHKLICVTPTPTKKK